MLKPTKIEQAQRCVIAALLALMVVIGVFAGLSSQQSSPATHNTPASERTDEQNSRQKEAKWVTADDWLAIFTLGLVLVGGVQLRLFWVQLGLIRESLDDAKTAADAAAETAKILVDNERPWVGPLTVACEQVGSNLQIVARVVIQNTGKTPARNMRAAFVGSVEPSSTEPPQPDVKSAPPKALFPGIPDIYRPFARTRYMTPVEFDGICKGTQILWIIGRIEYLDNRDVERWTNVRARWDQSEGFAIPHETGNDAN